jgi:hypothetical protein
VAPGTNESGELRMAASGDLGRFADLARKLAGLTADTILAYP